MKNDGIIYSINSIIKEDVPIMLIMILIKIQEVQNA
jgi:hypothetical protein